MLVTMLSPDSAVKRHDLATDSVSLPFDSMSAQPPGESATLGERLQYAIAVERHRGPNAVENALLLKRPDLFRSRGFMSSYINGRRGSKNPKPEALKAIADYLHVAFEWLVLGSGPFRKGGRGETPLEEAIFISRDWGIREDAFPLAERTHAARAEEMTAEEWFDAIRSAAARLDRDGTPRPEALIATRDVQASIRRTVKKTHQGREPK